MFRYHLKRKDEEILGYNFSFLMKLAAKYDPGQSKYGVISTSRIGDSFYQPKGAEKRHMIVFFSDDPEFSKYIRLSDAGNYYFGFRIQEMKFVKTFVARDKNKKSLSANKFLYSYMMKNYFQNSWFGTNNQMYIETRYKGHRKIHDGDILIDEVRRNQLLKAIEKFLKLSINTEKDQYEILKFFLRLKKEI